MRPWSLRWFGRFAPLRRLVKAGMALRYRDGRTYVIRRGPLAGLRWRHRREFQFWMPMGSYEAETAEWLAANLSAGQVFFDVGANAGYFVLLGGRRVGPHGRVVAFEPLPSNAQSVRDQVVLNGMDWVQVEEVALAADNGEAEFVVEGNNPNSHLRDVRIGHAPSRPAGSITVRTQTLDDFVVASGLRPDVVKIDVEGAESAVLRGATRIMRERRPRLIISTHGHDLMEECREILEAAGYRVEQLERFEHELLAYES